MYFDNCSVLIVQ